MNLAYAFAIAFLSGCGVYLLLSRHIVRIILGVAVLSAAVNLVIFYAGRIASAVPPVILPDASSLGPEAANPLPQALILTAIVIGFSLLAFTAALTLQIWRSVGTLDSAELDIAETLGSPFTEGKDRS